MLILARMLATSATCRAMILRVKALTEDLCGGRLPAVHESGYSGVAVPFGGLAVMVAMTGLRAGVIDPELDMATLWRNQLHAQAQGL